MSIAVKNHSAAILERVVVGGDLSGLNPQERMEYYRAICASVGLNPLTRPFDYLHLSGKLVLYAKRDATDQLRKIHGVSIEATRARDGRGHLCCHGVRPRCAGARG